jgi:hypothetical protein
VSGWICDSVDEMVAVVAKIPLLDRNACRREAQRFASSTMCAGYERVYSAMLRRAEKHGS